MGLDLDIHLDDSFGNRHYEVEPLPHDSLFYTSPPQANPPVASRDDDKGAPENDEDDEEQNEDSNGSRLRCFVFKGHYRAFSHHGPPSPLDLCQDDFSRTKKKSCSFRARYGRKRGREE